MDATVIRPSSLAHAMRGSTCDKAKSVTGRPEAFQVAAFWPYLPGLPCSRKRSEPVLDVRDKQAVRIGDQLAGQ